MALLFPMSTRQEFDGFSATIYGCTSDEKFRVHVWDNVDPRPVIRREGFDTVEEAEDYISSLTLEQVEAARRLMPPDPDVH